MIGAMQPTQVVDQSAPMPILAPEELAPHFPQLGIIECLGRGGMGVVYKARQKSLNRFVALKLLAPERADDPQFAARFEKEAHALAVLNHPHIVGVYDFGHAGGFYFLLMEFVDGVNLRQAMKAGRFTPEQALAMVPPVCEALQYAHEHGIVHRDIKPENLLLDKEGRVKIADFGIAKMLGESGTGVPPVSEDTTAGTLASLAGTPQYMSPEQKAHGVTDHRADIYSLGVVLYEMLTGELPADKLQPPSRKVQIDVRLDEIVLRALEKTPELRYQTAGEFRTQVETVVSTPRSDDRREEAQTESGNPSESLLASAPVRQTARVSDYASWGVFLLAYAGLLFLLATTASQLPPRVASHFDLEGRPNDWMSRASYLALFGCLPLLFGGVAVLISWMTRRLPARFINIPRRDFWLTPERRPAVAAFLRRRIFWLAVLMTAFLTGLHLLTVHANQSVPVHLSLDGLLALVMAFLLALLVWTICLLMRLAEVDKPLTSSTSSRGRESAPTKPEKSASLATSAALGEPRFSRTAIVGACWVLLFFTSFIIYIFLHTAHPVPPGEPVPSGPGPGVWLMMALMFIGFAAPLGTTILGWVAFVQIRRSAGRLRGKGLALFDGLFFPILAVLAVPIYFSFSKPGAPSPSHAANPVELRVPGTNDPIRINRVGQCVTVSHGEAVQFVLYSPEEFGHSVGGWTGTDDGSWEEQVNISLLRRGRSFTVTRSSATADHITIHGLKFRLDAGRAFVLGGDGRIEQVKFFPTPIEARKGGDMAAQIEKIRKEGRGTHTAMISENAFKAPEPRQEASNAQFRVTVHVFEAPADFEERDLRPGDLEDGNAVQMTNSTDVVVRSGGEGRIKVPELPLTSEGVSGGSGYKTRTLYVKPTLIAAGTRVRLVLERDVPETGARDFIYANSLQLGALTIIQSKSVGAHKQMAVMRVEMEGMKQEATRPRASSAGDQQFGVSYSHLISQIISLLVLLGFLYLVYRVWRRYGWWAAILLLIAGVAVVLMMTMNQSVKISSSSPRLVATLPDKPLQVVAGPAANKSSLTFGPVTERVVTNAIDFDTGNVGTAPLAGFRKPKPDAPFSIEAFDFKSIEQAGWDLIQHNAETIVGFSMKAVPIADAMWETLSPQQAVEKSKSARFQAFVQFSLVTNFPATYVFQTSEGGMGILQITGYTENPRGVKLRYKLVQGESP